MKFPIPKVIYMCHKVLDKIEIYSQKWKLLNPEYQIQLYDDNRCRYFLMKEYPPIFVKIFDFIPDGPIKADFWRVCIINKYGGVYVDADINPLVPLRDYISDDDWFVTCISNNFINTSNNNILNFNPHIIMAKKNNIILRRVIQNYIYYYRRRNHPFFKYSYWGWSICKFLRIPNVFKKKSQVLYQNGKKIKLLLELPDMNTCVYGGRPVLKNRYRFYKNHNFIR